MRAETLASRLINEVTNYGGLAMRRADVYRLACEHMGKQSGGRFGAWYFAMHGKALDVEPFSIDSARKIMGQE